MKKYKLTDETKKVLIACEESQTVCNEFRKIGIEAFSCDIIDCSGGHPEWHIMRDVIPLLNGRCEFETVDGTKYKIDGKWDLIVAHPPCTYLTNAGTRHYSFKMNPPEKVYARMALREEAAEFFMKIVNADCNRICIENPVGYMNTIYRKPDQIIHPYWFAKDEHDVENYQLKRTCLWLKNLVRLTCNKNIKHPEPMYILAGGKGKGKKIYWCEGTRGNKGGQAARAKARSKTFPGIARAMAEQWGSVL